MLSRVASSIFWLNRYIERAENYARFIEVNLNLSLDLPEGKVTIDGENQHVYKTARIGEVLPDGQIKEVWNSGEPIKPDPYLTGYAWYSG